MSNDNILSGVIVIDKHEGVTSHKIVSACRRIFDLKKVGHTGTLDPMATGVLPVLIGRAAKAADFLIAEDKKYEAVMRLGIVTDTGDVTGEIIARHEGALPTPTEVEAAAASFLGKIKQVPPMYSAIKVGGRKLVDMAREGIEIEREARDVEIYSIAVSSVEGTDCDYSLSVHCSKGTYIRTLSADIGEKLGCGATLASLRRTATGSFTEADAISVDDLAALDFSDRVARLVPTESLFLDLPAVRLPSFYAKLFHSGAEVYQKKIKTDFPTGQRVRMYDKNGFFAVGEVADFKDGSAIRMLKLFVI